MTIEIFLVAIMHSTQSSIRQPNIYAPIHCFTFGFFLCLGRIQLRLNRMNKIKHAFTFISTNTSTEQILIRRIP